MRRIVRESALVPFRLLLVALAAVALASAGCSATGGFTKRERVSEAERAAYQTALASLPADPAAAQAGLESFLQTYPDSALADDAAEELARLSLVDGRRDDAFRWLETLIERYPDGDRADSARVRLARWEAGRNDAARARELLAGVRVDRLDRSDQRAYYRLQAELADDPVDRMLYLAGLRGTVDEELVGQSGADADSAVSIRLRDTLEAVDGEIDRLLVAMTIEQLGRASVDLRGPPPSARIRLLLARRALDAGDFDDAKRLVDQATRYELTERDEERLASLELRLGLGGDLAGRTELPTWREAAAQPRPSLDDASGTIGVVLPLTGRFAPFGEEALRGIVLAARIFDAGAAGRDEADPSTLPGVDAAPPGGPGEAAGDGERDIWGGQQIRIREGVRLVVRDTGGVPERAAAAVRELAREDDVVAIVGPIFSDESEAAAREAEEVGVPLLTLSNRAEISSERDYVFRLRMTPDDEVGFLVDYAIEQLGARRFAVLYPQSRYGRGMRTRYWDAVLDRGGTMVAAAAYDPDDTDYSDAIRSMVGFDLLTYRESIALEERAQALRRGRRLEPQDAALLRRTLDELLGPEAEPLPPIVDFDALFVPDSHERIQLLAPQLAYHEVSGVQLLGSSEWNDPTLLRVGRRHVRGAVIATPFHRESEFDGVQRFVGDYEASFGQPPAPLASDAFDATNLVLEQIVQGREDREDVRDGVLRVRGYPGVSGVISIEPDGNARKRPFLLRVEGGRFVGID